MTSVCQNRLKGVEFYRFRWRSKKEKKKRSTGFSHGENADIQMVAGVGFAPTTSWLLIREALNS